LQLLQEKAPAGAGERCLECAVEQTCPFSAKKIYLDPAEKAGYYGWPTSAFLSEGGATVTGIHCLDAPETSL
jgi:hypothetical protein